MHLYESILHPGALQGLEKYEHADEKCFEAIELVVQLSKFAAGSCM
jgi:hypothetical protein